MRLTVQRGIGAPGGDWGTLSRGDVGMSGGAWWCAQCTFAPASCCCWVATAFVSRCLIISWRAPRLLSPSAHAFNHPPVVLLACRRRGRCFCFCSSFSCLPPPYPLAQNSSLDVPGSWRMCTRPSTAVPCPLPVPPLLGRRGLSAYPKYYI